ncbi:MAG TPA: GH3 auxin-responsive promoter family protein [Terriglobales bacterium]|nr:GH3 auxin-responsive promoter family protein [Terriglobales bacterium]
MTAAETCRLETFFGCLDSAAVQRDVLLRRVVWPNAQCEYGRKHDFGRIKSVQDFQQAVPLQRYDDFRPAIERMAHGESGVLVCEPVRRFFVTSGSSADPKHVPVTGSFIKDKWRAFQTYWGMVRDCHPDVGQGSIITNFSDGGREERTAGGLPCGSESSFWNAWGNGTLNTAGKGTGLPRELYRIRDASARYYAVARVLLEQDVTVLMALNPSTLVLLLDTLNDRSESLLRDVEQGGVTEEFDIDADVASKLLATYPANSSRSCELAALRQSESPRLPPWRVWRNLQLVICWRSPMVQPYLERLKQHLGAIRQRDYLLMASEGVIAIPFEDDVSGGAVATGIHFYEFIPEELADGQDPPTLLAHELSPGSNYVVVLSNSAGLYRYNIGDVVRVTGFVGTTPVLEFLYRSGHTCSLTGEKLTEDQVACSVYQAASRQGLQLQGFTFCPAHRPFPHYGLVAEFDRTPSRGELSSFIAEVERELSSRNLEYKAKRESRRLGAPELLVAARGCYAALRQRRIASGTSDAQVKIACLTRDVTFRDSFQIVERLPCASTA